mmetsp:Transcript_25435/g.72910  ORF Transcript_25435/g.72910 Transcript_25435/m.72910 type:complete len:373 (-) Transcript_25435:1221-2339(-)
MKTGTLKALMLWTLTPPGCSMTRVRLTSSMLSINDKWTLRVSGTTRSRREDCTGPAHWAEVKRHHARARSSSTPGRNVPERSTTSSQSRSASGTGSTVAAGTRGSGGGKGAGSAAWRTCKGDAMRTDTWSARLLDMFSCTSAFRASRSSSPRTPTTAPQNTAPVRWQHSAASSAEIGSAASEASTACTRQCGPRSSRAWSIPWRTSAQCSALFSRRSSSSLRRSAARCSAATSAAVPVPASALAQASAADPPMLPPPSSLSSISRPSKCTRTSRASTSPSCTHLPEAPGTGGTSGRTACCQESQPLEGDDDMRQAPAVSSSSSHQNASAWAVPPRSTRNSAGGSIQEPRFARKYSTSRKSIVTSLTGSVSGV